MATTINITKQADGTWQGSFNSTGTRTIVQVERQENAPLYLNISADDGQHNVIYQPPKDFKNQILSIDIAEGALVTIVSHSAVTKAQYIESFLDYYTKDEIDDMMAQIHQFEPVFAQVLPTASENTMYKIYFIPKSGGGETGNISEEWITIKTETATQGVYDYYWEKIGDTSTQIQADWNQTNTSSADFIKNKPTIPTVRTMNGEQLTGSSLGDINIHDGFYFPNAVQDYDGNWYGAVVIGDQVWLGENLRTTHYVNGTEIQTGESASTSTPYKYIPNSDAENVTEYGYLYNYPSVIGGTMLSGWRIPSRTNLSTLVDYIKKQKRYQYNNSSQNIGKSLASTNGWTAHTTDGAIGTDPELNNASGFNAKPAGDYSKVDPNPSETIRDFGIKAGFLSSTSPSNDVVSTLELSNGMTTASVLNQRLKSDAFSVRCISKLTPIQFRDWYIRQYGSMNHVLSEEVQEQADWNQSDNTKVDYIKNKPTNVSSFTNDAGFITENDLPTQRFLPTVTSSDNGKILIVDNGAWAAAEVPVADEIFY